jgi:hypothetical protein
LAESWWYLLGDGSNKCRGWWATLRDTDEIVMLGGEAVSEFEEVRKP